jgi:GT2 family glycosyltransferase
MPYRLYRHSTSPGNTVPITSAISVVMPAYNSAGHLRLSLKALAASTVSPCEIFVVDDGSTDDTAEVAEGLGVSVLKLAGPKGPAEARNVGALATKGDILLFIDADVCVAPDTLQRILQSFEMDPTLCAVIGAYDSFPSAPDFLSQYRNLMHSFVHGSHAREVPTFWTGCGAIRRDTFLSHGGFSLNYRQPAIEDIELGYRLSRSGCRIFLDPEIQVTHLKQWTLSNLIKTDILYRGIPWTELILRDRNMPNDLNLEMGQRISVVLTGLLAILTAAATWRYGWTVLMPPLTLTLMMLSCWWSESTSYNKPKAAYPVLLAMFVMIIGVLLFCHMPLLALLVALLPIGLLVRQRYSKGKIRPWLRTAGTAYFCIAAVLAVAYMPIPTYQTLIVLAIVSVTVSLNSRFYRFLGSARGLLFVLAAIPFHFLYHLYNALSFTAGAIFYLFGHPVPEGVRQVEDRAAVSK